MPPKEHEQRGLEEEDDDEEEGEAEAAFAVLVEQGREVAADWSKQGFQLHLSWLVFGCLNEQVWVIIPAGLGFSWANKLIQKNFCVERFLGWANPDAPPSSGSR